MAEERQRLSKEDIARQEEQELDKIRSQIPDLKIAHTLSDQNPLKKFLYNLENQTKPGPVYRAFCLFCLVVIWVIQGVAFYYDNPSAMAMLPLTLGMTYILLCLSKKKFSSLGVPYKFFSIISLASPFISKSFLLLIVNAAIIAWSFSQSIRSEIYIIISFFSLFLLAACLILSNIYSYYEYVKMNSFIMKRTYFTGIFLKGSFISIILIGITFFLLHAGIKSISPADDFFYCLAVTATFLCFALIVSQLSFISLYLILRNIALNTDNRIKKGENND